VEKKMKAFATEQLKERSVVGSMRELSVLEMEQVGGAGLWEWIKAKGEETFARIKQRAADGTFHPGEK
jgi:hypothetical protein